MQKRLLFTLPFIAALIFFVNQPAFRLISAEKSELPLDSNDVIHVSVFNNLGVVEIDQEAVLDSLGNVNLSLIGPVQIGGMSCAKAETLLAKLFDEKAIREPKVQVSISRLSEKDSVAILGGVRNPGLVKMRGQISLMDAIKLAGGFEDYIGSLGVTQSIVSQAPSGTAILNGPKGFTPGTAILKREKKEFEINLKKLFLEGDLSLNIFLKPNDVLFIPRNQPDLKQYQGPFVYVLGGVSKPGRYQFYGNLSLQEALILAGGLKKRDKIRFCAILKLPKRKQGGNGDLIPVDLQTLSRIKPPPQPFFLAPGDIVLFSTRSFNDFQVQQGKFVRRFLQLPQVIQNSPENSKAINSLQELFLK